jgi:putative aminopeptidase FrvX
MRQVILDTNFLIYCAENKIDYITKDGHWLMCQVGTTIQECPKVKGCYVGIPIDNYHSNTEIVNFKCISNVLKLFDAIKGEVNGKSGESVQPEPDAVSSR